MCGIAGYVGGVEQDLPEKMNRVQRHRGPDGEGIFADAAAEVALAHTRLAILDLSTAASQPMHSPDGRYVLIFNGEIYNFQELRAILERRGHHFVSRGDTEVILHGIMEEGRAFLTRLNGMFALAIWDRHNRELLLARDPLGIKPLYYATPKPGTLLFASEIKALCAHPAMRREPDFEVLQQHLAYGHAANDRTALRGVRRLEPGCILRWRSQTRTHQIEPFSLLPIHPSANERVDRDAAHLRELIRAAVTRQLVADVPLGVFLSGGLDSSLITALAANSLDRKLQCYTITHPSKDNELDRAGEDMGYARLMARQLGVTLREIELQPRVAELWPKLVWHLDEPIADPAAIACYLVCQLARSTGTKVLLSGQGGDELFCGYPRYWVMSRSRWLRAAPKPIREAIASAAHYLPGAQTGAVGAFSRRLRRGLVGLRETPERQFLGYCANTEEQAVKGVLSPAVREALAGKSFADDCLRRMEERGLSGLQKFRERDLSVYLPNHNLFYTDKMGMAAGVEARVPLLDLEVVAQSLRYPDECLVDGSKTKAILRDAAQGLVPGIILRRPKAGFGAPYRSWLRQDLAPMWNDLTSAPVIAHRGWFDYKSLLKARERSQKGQEDLYMLQWAVLTLELWAREFIDKNPSSP
jgi:asparagine synthase (glutamine-hydrolysing)